jgi:Domain of unknown function (DUF5666)
MRKYIVLGLTLLLVLGTVALAQTSGSTSGTMSKGDSMSKDSSKAYHRMHGEIASVDATAQTFTVKHGKDGKDISTFKTDNATKYKGEGTKDLTFSDLKVGDDVRVSFTENGSDKTAARVDVAHGKKS